MNESISLSIHMSPMSIRLVVSLLHVRHAFHLAIPEKQDVSRRHRSDRHENPILCRDRENYRNRRQAVFKSVR